MKNEKINLNELAAEVHQNAIEHGWWDSPKSFGDICALLHSEISEAFEEYRNSDKLKEQGLDPIAYYNENGKPEGIAVELADEIIRILDYCGHEKIDIQYFIFLKHEFNKTRPFKHGGKKI